jgi:ABC-type dipeptide/oligopeptide/nickel transport system permease subunit
MRVATKRVVAPTVSGQHRGKRSEWRRSLHRFRRNRGAVIGGIVLGCIAVMALAAPWITPYDPLVQDPAVSLEPPSWAHPFGTDLVGRDVLSRVIAGSRQSLLVGLVAIGIAASAGTLIGLLSGFYEGWFDLLIQRLIDIKLAFPGLLLALVIVATLGPGLRNAMIAVGISLIPSYTRLVRGSVLSAKQHAYVEAARVIGCRDARLVFRHILPNVAVSILVLATVSIAWAILIGSSLSFLGLGAQPPFPEWGRDLSEGRTYLSVAAWISTFPGLAIMLTIFSINLLGDGLRDALDPRLRNR